MTVAERIRRNVESMSFMVKDLRVPVTVSVGVAVVQPQPQEKMESVLEQADGALYESKEAGRNRVTLRRPQ